MKRKYYICLDENMVRDGSWHALTKRQSDLYLFARKQRLKALTHGRKRIINSDICPKARFPELSDDCFYLDFRAAQKDGIYLEEKDKGRRFYEDRMKLEVTGFIECMSRTDMIHSGRAIFRLTDKWAPYLDESIGTQTKPIPSVKTETHTRKWNSCNGDKKRYMGVREMLKYTGLDRNSAIKWCSQHGAAIVKGGRICFDRVAIDKNIDAL